MAAFKVDETTLPAGSAKSKAWRHGRESNDRSSFQPRTGIQLEYPLDKPGDIIESVNPMGGWHGDLAPAPYG